MRIIGIDPGLTGAIAVLDDKGRLVEVFDMPVIEVSKTAKVKKQVDFASLVCEFDRITDTQSIHCRAMVENQQPMPMYKMNPVTKKSEPIPQSPTSIFSLGFTFSTTQNALMTSQIGFQLIDPKSWKAYFRLGRDKEAMRLNAIRLFPDAAEILKRKKDHNRAEALMIAKFAFDRLTYGREVKSA